MRNRSRAPLGFLILAGAILVSAPILLAAQQGRDTGASRPRPLPYETRDKTLGVVTCASSLCHGSMVEWKDAHILQNEYITWSRVDKHARATLVLLNAQSRKIAKNLGLSDPAEKSKICLDCHAHNPGSASMGTRAKLSDGVTCEACHGPAERWVASHAVPGATHAQNIAHGLYPTDQPIPRARLCMSCHFGNADRFVTHRLMGAGHPRLSFELETFSQIGPSHFRVDADYEARKGKWNGAKVWAIGQALAVAETMKVLTDPNRGRDGLFPEFVLFDCYACHHPMSEKKWTSSGSFGGRSAPGLARLNDSNMLMLRAIMHVVDPPVAEEISARVVAVHRAIAGEGALATSAQALGAVAEQAAETIASHRFDDSALRGVALALVDEGLAGHYKDYAAAEQSVMAVGSVLNYMRSQGLLANVRSVNQGLARLRDPLSNDENYQPAEFQKRLQEFRTILEGLPASPQVSHD